MSTAPIAPCRNSRCPRRQERGGYCLQCWPTHRRPTARQMGYSSQWDKRSREWLSARPFCGQQFDGTFSGENSRCVQQGKFKVPARCVNHKVRITAGGSAMPPDEGLESLCVSCNTAHGRKTSPENGSGFVAAVEELPTWG